MQPVAIWALAILALFIMSVYRGEFQAALGSLVIGVFFPFIMAIAGLLAGVAPIILVIGLLVFFFKSANTPPPVAVSQDTYNKLKSIRR